MENLLVQIFTDFKANIQEIIDFNQHNVSLEVC